MLLAISIAWFPTLRSLDSQSGNASRGRRYLPTARRPLYDHDELHVAWNTGSLSNLPEQAARIRSASDRNHFDHCYGRRDAETSFLALTLTGRALTGNDHRRSPGSCHNPSMDPVLDNGATDRPRIHYSIHGVGCLGRDSGAPEGTLSWRIKRILPRLAYQ